MKLTDLEKSTRLDILRLLLAAKGSPLTDGDVKRGVGDLHPGVSFPHGDLDGHILDLQGLGLIAGTDDDIFGLMWALTPKGKIRAQQLPR
jgi:hypothetical protein